MTPSRRIVNLGIRPEFVARKLVTEPSAVAADKTQPSRQPKEFDPALLRSVLCVISSVLIYDASSFAALLRTMA